MPKDKATCDIDPVCNMDLSGQKARSAMTSKT